MRLDTCEIYWENHLFQVKGGRQDYRKPFNWEGLASVKGGREGRHGVERTFAILRNFGQFDVGPSAKVTP